MNKRKFAAHDVVSNLHRYCGCGSGFTRSSPLIETWLLYNTTNRYRRPTSIRFSSSLTGRNAQDWKNLVGTGPHMLTDWAEGSSMTWTENPDYRGFDEKSPGRNGQ